MTEKEKFQEYFLDGAKLATKIRPWLKQDDELATCFLVDNDIIKLHTNPWRKYEYARIFNDEKRASCCRVAEKIAKYIFSEKLECPTGVPMIMPPHAAEMLYVFRAVQRDGLEIATREVSGLQANLGYIDKFFECLLNVNTEENWFSIMSTVNPLLDLFLGYSDNAYSDFVNCCDLLERKRIGFFGKMTLPKNHLYKDEYDKSVEYYHKLVISDEYSKLTKKWFDRLMVKPEFERVTQKLTDAQVLASIELINKWSYDNNVQRKFILITGSEIIFDVVKSTGLQDCIRHPLGLICKVVDFEARRIVHEDEIHQIQDMYDWLKFFMAGLSRKFEKIKIVNDDCFFDMCQKVVDNDPEYKIKIRSNLTPQAIQSLRAPWDTYVQALIVSHLRDTLTLPDYSSTAYTGGLPYIKELRIEALKQFKEKLEKFGPEKIKIILSQRRRITWKSFYQTSAVLNVPLVFDGWQLMSSRCVPVVEFEDENVQRIMSGLLYEKGEKAMTPEEVYKALDNLKKSTHNYHYYAAIGLALIYAACNRWDLAETMAWSACAYADEIPKTTLVKTYVRGNEAYYVLAVCRRMNAKSSEGLLAPNGEGIEPGVKGLLTETIKRAKTFNTYTGFGDPRINAQSIALELSFHLFEIFMNDHNRPAWVDPLPKIGYRVIDHLESLSNLDQEKETVIVNKRRMFANLASTCYLCNFHLKDEDALAEYSKIRNQFNANEYLLEFNKSVQNREVAAVACPLLSFRVKSLNIVANVLWNAQNLHINDLFDKISTHFTESNINLHSILPYDGKRYRAIKKNLIIRLENPG